MKRKFKLSDSMLSHLGDEQQSIINDAMKEVECEKVVKRVTTNAPIMTDVDSNIRAASLYASTRKMDRDKEIIIPAGMRLDSYQKNPILLFAHQWNDAPIGSMERVHSDTYGIKGVANFADTQRGQEIWSLVRDGHLRTSSIGFIPTKTVERHEPEFLMWLDLASTHWPEFTEQDSAEVTRFITEGIMLENSIVPVPANPDALIESVTGKSYDPELLKILGVEEVKEKKPEQHTITIHEKTPTTEEKEYCRVISAPVKVISTPIAPVLDMEEVVKEQLDLHTGKI